MAGGGRCRRSWGIARETAWLEGGSGSRPSKANAAGACADTIHAADSPLPSVTCPQSIGHPLLLIAGPFWAESLWQQHLDLLRQQAVALAALAASGVSEARENNRARPMAAKPRIQRQWKTLCIPWLAV